MAPHRRHDCRKSTCIDCYLRLACISRRMGATSEAHRWAVKALELQGGHADALALMSQLYMERRCVWGGGRRRRRREELPGGRGGEGGACRGR